MLRKALMLLAVVVAGVAVYPVLAKGTGDKPTEASSDCCPCCETCLCDDCLCDGSGCAAECCDEAGCEQACCAGVSCEKPCCADAAKATCPLPEAAGSCASGHCMHEQL